MRRILCIVLFLLVPVATAGAVCGLPRPNEPPPDPGDRPPPEPPTPPPPPPTPTPPPPPDPTAPPTPDPGKPEDGAKDAPKPDPDKPAPDKPGPGPVEPGDEKTDPPKQPAPPPVPPVQPPTPGVPATPPPVGKANPPAGGPRPGRPGSSRAGPSVSFANAWVLWWELNRAHLLGLRKTLPEQAPATAGGKDPRIALRAELIPLLRRLAGAGQAQELRAAALVALGRAGGDREVRTFLDLIRSGDQPTVVRESAAIGLASLPKVTDPELRKEVRRFYEDLLDGFISLPGRVRQLAILAVSLRARDDAALARALGVHCKRPVRSSAAATALLYACGLTRDEFLAMEIRGAVSTGTLGRRKLHDLTRSNALLGLALTGKEDALDSLVAALRTGNLGVHSRRSALLGIGIILRDPVRSPEVRKRAETAVLTAFVKNGDPLAAGFAAMAMGTAFVPFGAKELTKAVDKTGDAVVRPFAALALGLSVDRLDAKTGDHVRRFLLGELEKTRNVHLAGALSIAVGVAGIQEARPALLARAADGRQFGGIRTSAIEALGILRSNDPEVMKALVAALNDASPPVVQSASVALGFAGGPSTASALVAKLAEAPWKAVQVHMVVGLSHLGGTAAVKPLLELAADPGAKLTARCSAATALGILLAPGDRDPLFEIDACCNPYALTSALRELVRVY